MQKEYELQMKKRILEDLELRKERKEKLKEIEAKLLQKYEENAPLFVGVNADIAWFESEYLDILAAIEQQKAFMDNSKLAKHDIFNATVESLSKDTKLTKNYKIEPIEPIKLEIIKIPLINFSINTHIKKTWKEWDHTHKMYDTLEQFVLKLKFNKASIILEKYKENNIVDSNLEIVKKISNMEQEKAKYELSICDSSHLLTLIDGEYYCPMCKHKEEDADKIDKNGRLIIHYNRGLLDMLKRNKVLGRTFKLHYITNFDNVSSYRKEFVEIVNENILKGKDAYQISRILHKRYNINMFTYKG
jgi:hypothetical protein